eukprot:6491042-Amphidinium_carterae.3
MMRINQATTFDEVHQWISNYFNSTYTGTDDGLGTTGGVNNYEDENYNEENYDEEFEDNAWYNEDDKIMIAFMKGKSKGQRKGERRQWQRKRWKDNSKNNKGQQAKGYQPQQPNYLQGKAINNNSLPIKGINTTVDNLHHLNTQTATTRAMANNGPMLTTTKMEKKTLKFQSTTSVTMTSTTSTTMRTPAAWDYYNNQEWYPETDYSHYQPGQEVEQQQVLQRQQSTTSPLALTLGSLYIGTGQDDDNVTVHMGNNPYIEKKGLIEQLHPLGAHLHAAAMVLPGLHKPSEIKLDSSINSRYNPSLLTNLIVGDIEEVSHQLKPISPNKFDNHHNHPNKNKMDITLHTCHTDRGVQSASRPKGNLYIIDAVDSKNNL